MRFQKHYTHDEARALLPHIRLWLKRLHQLQEELKKYESRLDELMTPGRDLGGELVNRWVRSLVEIRDVLLEFYHREIQIKDLERGLLDFPAMLGDKEVFLCWEEDEEDIGFWHELDAGYSGREPL